MEVELEERSLLKKKFDWRTGCWDLMCGVWSRRSVRWTVCFCCSCVGILVLYIAIILIVAVASNRGRNCISVVQNVGTDARALGPRYDLFPSLAPDYDESQSNGSLRLHQIPFNMIGYHNSYTMKPRFIFPGFNLLVPEWKYEHEPISEQLQKGNRKFELDIHIVDDKFLVYHVQVGDDRSRCKCLEQCFSEMAAYLTNSSAPEAPPGIVVFMQFKVAFLEDVRTGSQSIKDVWFQNLERAILTAFPREALMLPVDMQGNFSTLNEAIQTRGWPLESELRGKAIMVFYYDERPKNAYRAWKPDPRDRVCFVEDDSVPTETAFVINDYISTARMAELVRKNSMLLYFWGTAEEVNQTQPQIMSTDVFTDEFLESARHPRR